ncbi:hypothetical protein BVG19_g2257 [[Candida] boidinii]|nr:hypothetical protein BVG19_g2257 [[Candida] boidinii]OWB52171.1 hypothetical protein B5S27_g3743 [[Candida] boidinii]
MNNFNYLSETIQELFSNKFVQTSTIGITAGLFGVLLSKLTSRSENYYIFKDEMDFQEALENAITSIENGSDITTSINLEATTTTAIMEDTYPRMPKTSNMMGDIESEVKGYNLFSLQESDIENIILVLLVFILISVIINLSFMYSNRRLNKSVREIKNVLRDHETRISQIQFTCERLLFKEDEVFAEYKRMFSDQTKKSFDQLEKIVSSKILRFDELIKYLNELTMDFKLDFKEKFKLFENCKHEINNKILTHNENFSKLDVKIRDLTNKLIDSTDLFKTILNNINEKSEKVNKFVNKSMNEISEFKKIILKDLEINKIQLVKSNILLLDSKILLDTSINKFEYLINKDNLFLDNFAPTEFDLIDIRDSPKKGKVNGVIEDKDLIEYNKRLGGCLTKLKQSNICIDEIANIKDKNLIELDGDSVIEGGENVLQENLKYKNYIETTDLIFSSFNKRQEKLEIENSIFSKKIDDLKNKLESTNNKMNFNFEKITHDNNSWVKHWFSIIYGLFLTDINNMEEEINNLKKDPENDTISNMEKKFKDIFKYQEDSLFLEIFDNFIKDLKKKCLFLIRDSNLILFNYYLLRNDTDNKTRQEENKILSEILENIEQNYQLQINNFFKKLNKFDKMFEINEEQERVNGSRNVNGEKLKDWLEFKKIVLGEVEVLEAGKKADLKHSHLNFKEKLVYDLKMALKNFNLMFKENIDGFYIIMKAIRDEDIDTQEEITEQSILNKHNINDKKFTNLEGDEVTRTDGVVSSKENSDKYFINDTKRGHFFKIPEAKRKNKIIQSTISKVNNKYSGDNQDNHEDLEDGTVIFDNFIHSPPSKVNEDDDVLALSPSSVSSYASSPKEEWEITSDILSKESSNEIINLYEIDKASEISNIDINGVQTYKKSNKIKGDNRNHKENHYNNFKPLKLVQKKNNNLF